MTSWLNNNFRLLALTLLAMLSVNVVWGATEEEIYTCGFEATENFTASQTYTGSMTGGATNKQWTVFRGAWSTSSKITGSQSAALRMYNGSGTDGYLETNFKLSKLTYFSFKAKAETAKSSKWKIDVQYSTDGSNWTNMYKESTCTNAWSAQTPATSATSYSAYMPTAVRGTVDVYIRFAVNSGSTKPSSSNSQLTIDDIVAYGASTPSCTTPPTVSSSLSNTSSTTSSITATVGITSIGGCDITENGLVYSTTETTPTVGGSGCSKETVTACGSTAANKTVTISGLACGQRYYVCGYATNAAGTRYSNVSQISTSACPVDHFIDNIQETSGYTGDGKAVSTSFTKLEITLSDKAATTSGSCEDVHYHFVGWVTEADRSAGNVDAEHIVNFQDSGNVPTGTTYYAVWAKEDEEQ